MKTMQLSWVSLFLVMLRAFGARDAPAPGAVVQPKLVIPGEWMVDKTEKFMFLPLTVPQEMRNGQVKIMSNGESILVVVTEKPQDEPDTNAVRKFKLVMEAIKKEAMHDEKLLKEKLQTWFDTEDDDEVRVRIRATIDSLTQVVAAKDDHSARTISVPLGMLVKDAAVAMMGVNVSVQAAGTSFLAKASVHNASKAEPMEVVQAEHALPSLHSATTTQADGKKKKVQVGIIKESFAIEIPYPVPTEKVFLLQANPNMMMVSMPLKRNSLEAKGISTGGKPFLRVPSFSVTGELLAGPKDSSLKSLAGNLHVPSVANKQALKPLP